MTSLAVMEQVRQTWRYAMPQGYISPPASLSPHDREEGPWRYDPKTRRYRAVVLCDYVFVTVQEAQSRGWQYINGWLVMAA